MGNATYEKLMNCYKSFQEKIDFHPEVAIVLGSGLGDFANEIKVEAELSYSELEGFPVSTVAGHDGKFIFGYLGDIPVVCMKGRVHYYEGYPISDVVLPIRLMKLMGAEVLFLSNAAGGLNTDFKPGDLMMITDHIACFAPNPLLGPNVDELVKRFPDLSNVYDEALQDIIRHTAEECGLEIKEGVYTYLTGPSYESPADIRMLRVLGADAVGMSTVPEAIAANHMGMKICGISCITNMAAGILKQPLDHKEVQETADKAAQSFQKLVTEVVKKVGA